MSERVIFVTSVVPRLAPAIDGLGDYAFLLAQKLRQHYGIQTQFVVGDPNWLGASDLDGFPVSQIEQRSSGALAQLLTQQTCSTILLHYSGYGYQKRGCPIWLVDGLGSWKQQSNIPLILMFHEIYASGPPWASSFWLSPLQRNLACRLAKMSDALFTNRAGYKQLLHQLSGRKDISVFPVFSNIGEPLKITPLSERQRQLVVFGGRGNRSQVYQESLSQLNLACHLLGIEKIVDVGLPVNLPLKGLVSIPVKEMGPLPAAQVSEILSCSLAGFFNYPVEYLAKSTIFAAYCAHGVFPVSGNKGISAVDGLETGTHYWYPEYNGHSIALEETQAIATTAYDWYQTHNLKVQTQAFAQYLLKIS